MNASSWKGARVTGYALAPPTDARALTELQIARYASALRGA